MEKEKLIKISILSGLILIALGIFLITDRLIVLYLGYDLIPLWDSLISSRTGLALVIIGAVLVIVMYIYKKKYM